MDAVLNVFNYIFNVSFKDNNVCCDPGMESRRPSLGIWMQFASRIMTKLSLCLYYIVGNLTLYFICNTLILNKTPISNINQYPYFQIFLSLNSNDKTYFSHSDFSLYWFIYIVKNVQSEAKLTTITSTSNITKDTDKLRME